MKKAFTGEMPVMVLIDGEEDLLTIPAVINAPIGAWSFTASRWRGSSRWRSTRGQRPERATSYGVWRRDLNAKGNVVALVITDG